MSDIIFYSIIAFIIFNWMFGLFLDWLDSTLWSNELPEEVAGIYDAEKYRKSLDYEKITTRFSWISGTFSFVILLGMLLFNGFAFVDHIVREYTVHPILVSLAFFALLGLASDILGLPFEVYSIFHIEQKFGFNTMKVKTFIFDKIKSYLLSIIIGGGLLSLIILIYLETGPWFWLIAWGVLSAFMLFMSLFYSNLIVPLFNKQTPLEEGDLRNQIETFANKTGFILKNIYIINGSKRSKKANAYFTGFGPKKRIVLYDTLVNDLTNEEIVAVLAHEIGHYKKKHVLFSIISSIITNGIMLFILSLFLGNPDLANALGTDTPSFHIGLLAMSFLFAPLSMITGIAANYFSRKKEYVADKFAAENFDPEAMKNALKKLSLLNLSNLKPHPFTVFITYSHPTVLQRIKAIDKIKKS